LKSSHPSPFVTEALTRQKVVFSLENKEEKRVLIVAEKKKQKADYEREEYQNDVRYQNRTEITLDYGLAKRNQGLFHCLDICRLVPCG
jgi:hypothetical protein